jgi:hypothetical protein
VSQEYTHTTPVLYSPIFFHSHQDAFSAVDLSKHEKHGGVVGNGSHHTLEVDLLVTPTQPDTYIT